MNVKSNTPRTCPAHFALHEIRCAKGCGELCIVQEPEKVNAELARYQQAMPEEPQTFYSCVNEHTKKAIVAVSIEDYAALARENAALKVERDIAIEQRGLLIADSNGLTPVGRAISRLEKERGALKSKLAACEHLLRQSQ